MIAESSIVFYYPEIPHTLLVGMVQRVADWRDATYQPLWVEFGIPAGIASNITVAAINAAADEFDPDEELARFTGGFYDYSDPFWADWGIGPATLAGVSLDEPEPTGYGKVITGACGYRAWQCYALHLAMQATKISQFHRRGRPDGI